MTPEQHQDISNRIAKLEAEKGTSDVILSTIQKMLGEVMAKIDKALIYNEKHDNLSKEVETLRTDYAIKKQEIDRSIGWLKGAFATAGVTVAIIAALMMFIAKDGLTSIQTQDIRLQETTHKVERLETRLNYANPKSP